MIRVRTRSSEIGSTETSSPKPRATPRFGTTARSACRNRAAPRPPSMTVYMLAGYLPTTVEVTGGQIRPRCCSVLVLDNLFFDVEEQPVDHRAEYHKHTATRRDDD